MHLAAGGSVSLFSTPPMSIVMGLGSGLSFTMKGWWNSSSLD